MRQQILAGLATLIVLAITLQGRSEAHDWPQWRGPERDGISTEGGLRRNWPPDGPQRIWLSRNAGLGYSSPSVVGDRMYIMGSVDGKEMLLAMGVDDGSQLWSTEIGERFNNNRGDGPRGTPTVDGELVYALGAQGDLLCVRVADGNAVWRARMQDFGGRIPNWGYSESVLIDGSHLICTPGGEGGSLLALNKKTGEKIWQSDQFTDAAHYSSIIVAEHAGTRQYIQRSLQNTVGVAAEDGRLLWMNEFPGRTAVAPTPIFHNGFVYVSAGYNAGCELLRLGDENQVEQIYNNKNMKNQHGGVVRVGDHLYGFSDGQGWVCQDFATGNIVWREREPLGKGCLVCAGGMLYLVEEKRGGVVLIEASPDGWEEHGRFTLSPQSERRKPSGRIWTHPVVVDGRLYLRDQELLFCFDVRE
jgi:hypothetical protein